jgi:hypothetical protein
MTQSIVANGALKDALTVVLDEPLPVSSGRVEVSIRLTSDEVATKHQVATFLRDLRARQAERGHVPLSAAEIEAQIAAERANWGD